MIKIIKAIIFDVDDTLIDFSRKTIYCYMETAKELNLKPVKKEIIFKFYGTPLKNMIKKLWPKANSDKFEKISLEKVKKIKAAPFKKAIPIIKSLSKKYKLGVLTSKRRVIMNLNFKQIRLSKKFFKFSHGKEDVKYHKPDPRAFSKAIKILKLKPEEILYVGDAIYDCIAATKAKLNFVAVLTGHYKKNEFKKYNVKDNNILKSIRDLPKWLNENNK